MRSKLSKIMGIGLALVLIASMMVFAIPVSADPGENEWSAFAYPDPGAEGDWFYDPSITGVGPIAQVINGDLYASKEAAEDIDSKVTTAIEGGELIVNITYTTADGDPATVEDYTIPSGTAVGLVDTAILESADCVDITDIAVNTDNAATAGAFQILSHTTGILMGSYVVTGATTGTFTDEATLAQDIDSKVITAIAGGDLIVDITYIKADGTTAMVSDYTILFGTAAGTVTIEEITDCVNITDIVADTTSTATSGAFQILSSATGILMGSYVVTGATTGTFTDEATLAQVVDSKVITAIAGGDLIVDITYIKADGTTDNTVENYTISNGTAAGDPVTIGEITDCVAITDIVADTTSGATSGVFQILSSTPEILMGSYEATAAAEGIFTLGDSLGEEVNSEVTTIIFGDLVVDITYIKANGDTDTVSYAIPIGTAVGLVDTAILESADCVNITDIVADTTSGATSGVFKIWSSATGILIGSYDVASDTFTDGASLGEDIDSKVTIAIAGGDLVVDITYIKADGTTATVSYTILTGTEVGASDLAILGTADCVAITGIEADTTSTATSGAFQILSSATGILMGSYEVLDRVAEGIFTDGRFCCALMKSTAVSGGRTWAATGYTGGPVVDMVCSELSEDVIYVTDGNYVYKSVTGGTSFNFVAKDDLESNLVGDCGIDIIGEPITSIDVGYDGANKPVVFIGTVAHPIDNPGSDSLAGSVYWIADESFPAQWTDLELKCYGCCDPEIVGSQTGYYDVYAVGCAPDFATSSKVYAVITTDDDTCDSFGEPRTHVVSTIGTTCSWTFVSELVWNCDAANNFDISHASRIVFPSYYGTNPTLFVGVAGVDGGGDVYRVADTTPPSAALDLNVLEGGGCSGEDTNICSLDILNDALIAGANDGTDVYYSADNGWNWTASKKNPTGEDLTYVLFAGDSVLAATAGTECAVSMSCGEDIGKFWNQISLIDTDIDAVLDISHAPGYLTGTSPIFIATKCEDPLSYSLFRYDQTNWERVYSTTDPMDWVQVSPDFGTTDCVYLANTEFEMFRSLDAGCSWAPLLYPCETRPDISAWIVVDQETVLAAGTGTFAGNIYKTTYHGTRPWDAFPVTGAGAGVDFDLSPNIANDSSVLFGDANGQVFLSTDLGATWTIPEGPPVDADVYVQFDPGYGIADDPGENIFYAAAATAIARYDLTVVEAGVVQCTLIGTIGNASGIAAAGDTALYVADADAEAGVWRSLNPIAATTEVAAEFEQLVNTDPLVNPIELAHPSNSDDLWLTAGSNMLWALDSDTATIWVWDDPLATPVIQIQPAGGALLATTATATIEWEPLDGAVLYEYFIFSFCATCPDNMVPFEKDTTALTCNVIDGLTPGTTYYWQVRVASGEPVLSKWSELRSFDTALSSMDVLRSPACGAQDVILTPSFSWEAVTGATGYEVQISTNEGFNPIIASGTPTVNAWAAASDLDYSTTYYWQVRAVKGDVVGAWSVCLFTTMDEPAEPITPVDVITEEIVPIWIWVIIGIGAALVICVIVLIVNTRRVP